MSTRSNARYTTWVKKKGSRNARSARAFWEKGEDGHHPMLREDEEESAPRPGKKGGERVSSTSNALGEDREIYLRPKEKASISRGRKKPRFGSAPIRNGED